MRDSKKFTLVVLGIFFCLFLGSLILVPALNWTAKLHLDTPSTQLEPCNGLVLFDDESRNDTIPVSTDYQYATSTCLPARYQLVWLQPKAPSNFDLYVFNDTSYLNLQAASMRTGSNLDWVVFRSSDEIAYRVIVNSSTDSGSVHIEWEDSSVSVPVFNNQAGELNESECGELFEVYMNQTSRYDFQLELGIGLDADLYIYALDEGEAVNYDGSIAQSVTSGVQINEQVMNWLPPATGKYAVVIIRRSGSGTFTIRFDRVSSGGGIPAFELVPILFGLCLAICFAKNIQTLKKIP
jgi:hypothetical protein